MPILKPGSVNPRKKNIIILLYGVEGAFKTSTALTSDNAILHDFNDGGSSRAVNISEKTRFIPEKGWPEFIHMLNNGDFDDYDVHIVDTVSDMLMRFLAQYLMLETPSLKSPTGGLTKDGYAALSARFQEDFISKYDDKILLFIAHDAITQEGDLVKHGPSIPGAAGQYILGNADQIGYVEKTDKGGVIIRFSNSNAWRSKDTAKVGDIEIPPHNAPEYPSFFQDKVINPLSEALNMTKKKKEIREASIKIWEPKITSAKTDVDLNKIREEAISANLDTVSLAEVRNLVRIKAEQLGLEFSKQENKFIKIKTKQNV